MHFPWTLLTNFGNSVSTVLAAMSITAWLFFTRAHQSACVWLASFTTGTLIVVLTKIAFIGWGIGFAPLDFKGASGHAALSTAVLTTVGYLLSLDSQPSRRFIITGVGAVVGLAVGAARVALQFHSPAEAICGWTLGIIVALVFVNFSRDLELRQIPRFLTAICGTLFITVGVAYDVPAQRWITELALYLSGHFSLYVAN